MANPSPTDTDVTDIFDLLDLPIIRADVYCAIVCFNEAASRVFHLRRTDIGRPIRQVETLLDHINIQDYCRKVIADGSPSRHEVRDRETRFLLRIAAYPGRERPTIGAVLTFMNITAFHSSIQQAIYEREFTKAILNTVTEPLIVLDAELRVQTANRAFFTMFHVTREETHGSIFAELKRHKWDMPQLWQQLKDFLKGEQDFPPLELDHDFPTLGNRTILLTAHRLFESGTQMILLTFRDVSDRKQEEQARAHLAALVDSSDDAIISKDLQGIVTTWNRGAERLFGYTAREMLGSPVARLIHSDRNDEEPDILDRIRNGKTIDHYETVRCRKDGTRLDISLTVSPIIDTRGRIVGASKIARDITKRKQTDRALRASEERLRQLTSTLEERVKQRTQELAISSTRLRALATELTVAEQTERRRMATQLHDYLAQLLVVIRMKTSQLLQQHHEPEVRKVLEEADQLLLESLEYTRSLVAELIPQALYDRGLGAALLWLGDQMRRQQVLNVDVSVDASELGLPEEDAVLLFHSIRELLFNVLKHGKTDAAAVAMRYANNALTIRVSDQGCGFNIAGLSGEDVNRFGLLSIRERMIALGGRFELHSESGQGTTATLVLPLEEGYRGSSDATPDIEKVEIRRASHAQREEIPSQHPIRVLLVDDHAMMREGLRSVLDTYSAVQIVGEAQDGEEALALVESLRPSVVVMDIHMPKLNGIEATVHIKSCDPTCRVIGLSANTDGQEYEAMRQAGADVVLAKDVVSRELYQAILKTMAGYVP
ncbi:MAG: PAS domain S-box protein [Nitrospirales bacterium]